MRAAKRGDIAKNLVGNVACTYMPMQRNSTHSGFNSTQLRWYTLSGMKINYAYNRKRGERY